MALNTESAQHLIDASTGSSRGMFTNEEDKQEKAFARALTEVLAASLNELIRWQTEWSGVPAGVTGISEASGKNLSEARLQISRIEREDLQLLAAPLVSLGSALAKEIAALRDTWNGSDFAHHSDFNLSDPLDDGVLLQYDDVTLKWTDVTVASLGAVMDSDFSTNGLMVRTGAGTYTTRSIVVDDGKLTVSNGDGVADNPSLGFGSVQLTDLSDVAAKSGSGTTVIMQGSPVLTTPTVADFTNSTHNHQAAAGGGQLDHGLALTGLGDDDHTQYLLADGTRALTANWDAGAFSITANQLRVGDADDAATPSEYLGVGASQDGKLFSLAVGTVYLDAVTSDADFYLRANDGGSMKNFLVIDASEALLTLGQTGDIMLGADGTVIDVYPETTKEANLGTSLKKFNEVRCDKLFTDNGIVTVVATNDVSNPPTDADLDSAFGTPAAVGEGFIGIVDDNNVEANVWLCVAVGSTWWYEALSKAV